MSRRHPNAWYQRVSTCANVAGMSLVYLEVMVRCDHESQGRVCAEFVYAHTPNEAYDDAREDGWQIDPAADGDYCPKHRA